MHLLALGTLILVIATKCIKRGVMPGELSQRPRNSRLKFSTVVVIILFYLRLIILV